MLQRICEPIGGSGQGVLHSYVACPLYSDSVQDIDSVFSDIPYKTLLKIFNRLEDEGIVYSVSKGIYRVGN